MKHFKVAKNRILTQLDYMDLEDLYQLKLIKRHMSMASNRKKKDLLDELDADF
jgi:hypothetical protein